MNILCFKLGKAHDVCMKFTHLVHKKLLVLPNQNVDYFVVVNTYVLQILHSSDFHSSN